MVDTDSGRYDWDVPDISAPEVSMRISDVNNNLTTDTNDSTFQIVDKLPIHHSTAGNSVLQIGAHQLIQVPTGEYYHLDVYTLKGEHVKRVDVAKHGMHWDGRDKNGMQSENGVLILTLIGEGVKQSFKVLYSQ